MDCFNGAVSFIFALFVLRFGFTEHVIKLTRGRGKTNTAEGHAGLKTYPKEFIG